MCPVYWVLDTPLISSDDIKKFVSENQDLIKKDLDSNKDNNLTLFLTEAKKKGVLSLKDSQNYMIPRRTYDMLSKKLQASGEVIKLKNNSLVFKEKKNLNIENK